MQKKLKALRHLGFDLAFGRAGMKLCVLWPDSDILQLEMVRKMVAVLNVAADQQMLLRVRSDSAARASLETKLRIWQPSSILQLDLDYELTGMNAVHITKTYNPRYLQANPAAKKVAYATLLQLRDRLHANH